MIISLPSAARLLDGEAATSTAESNNFEEDDEEADPLHDEERLDERLSLVEFTKDLVLRELGVLITALVHD